ncbi:MAG: EamA family transporter [Acidobacteriaceae bacterium]|jgi:drug/metabolite transporter (DMT)-like permease
MQNRTLGFASCTLASALWGCGFFFGKIALAEMNVGAMVLYRFAFATLALVPLLITHPPRFTKKEWRTLLLCALLGIPLQFLIQFSGLARTTVSHASLMVGTLPVILAVGATLFAHERMDLTGWLALAASTAGAAFIALSTQNPAAHTPHTATAQALTDNPTLTGDLLVVLSMFIALGWILLNKRLMRSHSAITVSAYGITAGTLMLLILVPLLYREPFGPLPIAQISTRAWLALAASGLLCTAATTLLWNWGLTQVPASQAGVLLNMEPLIGSLLGVFLLHETLGPSARLGALLILAASLVITTRSRTTTPNNSL